MSKTYKQERKYNTQKHKLRKEHPYMFKTKLWYEDYDYPLHD